MRELALPLYVSADTDSNIRLILDIWSVPLSKEPVANYEGIPATGNAITLMGIA